MTIDNSAITKIYKVAQAFEKDFNPDNFDIIGLYHEYDDHEHSDLPQYRVCVVVEDIGNFSTFVFPIAEFGRKQGLFLFDTVSNWEDETVKLRFGYKA